MISDNQRRIVCRILFLLVCAAPTMTVVYWMCHRPTASHWQQQFRAQLGLSTTIDSIETPGPHVTILRGLTFTDPELGEIFDTMEVRIEMGKTNTITFPQKIRMTNAGLVKLVQTIDAHMLRAHAATGPWKIQFLDQTIVQESIHAATQGENKFPVIMVAENLQINVDPMSDGTIVRMQFQPPKAKPDQWITGELCRSHPDSNRHSLQRLVLNTHESNLPCWLLGDLVPDVQRLGPDCQFMGLVDINPPATNPRGWFQGTFTQIASSAVTGEPHSDPRLRYAAEVKICRFEGGIPKLDAELVRPDGSRTPIRNTLTVIEHFDFARALRIADESNNYQNADSDRKFY